MTSVLKFNNWQSTSGTAYGTVLQTVEMNFSDTTTTASTTFVDISGSSFSLTTLGANSKIYIIYNGSAYKAGSDTSGYGIQLYRSAPTTAEVYTPYATWGANGHSVSNNFGGVATLHAIDTPNVAAGTTLSYKFRVASYSSSNTVYINYPSTYSGYAHSSNIIAVEVAP